MLARQVAGHQGAEAARAARDQHRALGVEGLWHPQHDLSNVAGLAHEPEGLRPTPHVPGRDRQGLKRAALEQLQHLGEHLANALRPRFDQVEGAVSHAGMARGNLLGIADVGLAHLDEATAARQQLQRRIYELAGQRVEDHVDAAALGGAEELLLELQVSRRGDVGVIDPQLSQGLPLAGAGAREHLGSQLTGQLHCRHADPSGCRVDQHCLPGLELRQIHQGVVSGQEGDRHRRRFHERPALGHPDDHSLVGHRDRAERPGHEAHHPVARRDIRHPRADLEHHSRALAADRRLPRVEIERDQHISEVQPGGPHADTDLSGGERLPRLGTGKEREVLERPLMLEAQTPRLGPRWRHQGAIGPHPGQAGREERSLAHR